MSKPLGICAQPNMQDFIVEECNVLKTFLLEKNASYGNSIAEPMNIFYDGSALDAINVRLDDKLARMARGHEYAAEDTELDLLGYLLLKRAVRRYLVEVEAEGGE